jgi:hypothetical protein
LKSRRGLDAVSHNATEFTGPVKFWNAPGTKRVRIGRRRLLRLKHSQMSKTPRDAAQHAALPQR